MKTWLITGASRGFGAALAEAALARGDAVVATARRPEDIAERLGRSDRLLPLRLDVTDPAEARAAVAAAHARFGQITVLVNNAGYGLIGAIEEVSDDLARAVFETNVFGLLNVTRACLPTLRRQRRGHVINIGSIAGIRGTAGLGLYNATKFAVAGITEALHAELEPLGIRVTAIELGQMRTDFLAPGAISICSERIDDYIGGPSEMVRDFVDQAHHRQPGDPRRAAEVLIDVVEADAPPMRLPVGEDAVLGLEAKLRQTVESLRPWRDRASDVRHPEPGGYEGGHGRYPTGEPQTDSISDAPNVRPRP